MALGHYLRVGDKTTCGGQILSGSEVMMFHGKPMGREGDKVTCGKHSGTYTIIGGIAGMRDENRLVAGTLDSISSCPCRAKLITSMPTDTYEKKSSSKQTANSPIDVARPVSSSLSAEGTQSSLTQPLPVPPIPVFAKSCLRGTGCTDAGIEPEPHSNFGEISFYQTLPSSPVTNSTIEQHAQSAKRKTADPTPEDDRPWYKRILGIGEPTPPTAPIIPAAMFPEGALALTFVGGRIMTTGTWAIDAAPAVGRIAVAGAGAPIAVAIIGMMPSRLNDGEQDFIDDMRLAQIAEQRGTAPTRVRYRWEDAGNGRPTTKGYHTPAESGQDQVPVRKMELNSLTGNYEFWEDGAQKPTILWNPAEPDVKTPTHTGNNSDPILLTTTMVTPLPEKVGSDIETYPAPEERSFRDYILILPLPSILPIYIYLNSVLKGKDAYEAASKLGYDRRISPQKAPFDSHGQQVFYNGKKYITPDVDSHNVTNGWKMFNSKGKRIGTYDSELNRIKD